MSIGSICPERDRLSRAATCGVNAHNEIVSKVDDKVNPEEVTQLRDEIRTSFLAAQAAWEEYRKHIKEHGC
jgi:hypothetical protein